ncbi:hypothetical protein LINGRAHAP2_LOCUS10254, partial [Linum grandiflorum]
LPLSPIFCHFHNSKKHKTWRFEQIADLRRRIKSVRRTFQPGLKQQCEDITKASDCQVYTLETSFFTAIHLLLMYLIIGTLFFTLDNILIANSASIGCFL